MRSKHFWQRHTPVVICTGILLLGFLTFFSLPDDVQACSPGEPDYWYQETLKIDPDDMPEKIEITRTEASQTIRIRNESSVFYNVWLLTHKAQEELANEGRYVNGETIANQFVEESFVLKLKKDYRLLFFGHNPLNSSQNDWSTGSIIDFSYPNYQNLNIAADGLMGEPEPIPPQQFNIAFNVEGTLQIVPLVIHYESNPDYDPNRYANGVKGCIEFNLTVDAIYTRDKATIIAQSAYPSTTIQQNPTPIPPPITPGANGQIVQQSVISHSSIILWSLLLISSIVVALFLSFRTKSYH